MPTEANTKIAFVDAVPMWLAVAITVLVSMPFGLWLGEFNLALWCSFIVWAEYFALGARPSSLRLILPSFSYAAAMTALILWSIPLFAFLPDLLVKNDLRVSTALFLGIAALVYTMRFSRVFQDGSLPFFNGISMALAVYFTGSYPDVGLPAAAPLVAGAWTIVLGVFGCGLGVFNVWITFPRPKSAQ